MEIVLATRNPGKIREIREILDLPWIKLLTFEDLPSWPALEESGKTFEENATLKARALRDHSGLSVLADDSGLVVDYLDGQPGVLSSRYAGPDGDPDRNMDKLLGELEGVPGGKRSARFVCVVALALAGGEIKITRGECGGTILTSRRGTGGFGYDPVFKPRGFRKSMAELSPDEKNAISHRGEAFRQIREILEGATEA